MAQTIKIKRSATSGNKLTGSNSVTGEFGLNTADKSLYIQTGSTDASVVTVYDDSILHLDDTNNRVGIGTTSPTHHIHITGGITNGAIGFSSEFIKIGTYSNIGYNRIFGNGADLGLAINNGALKFLNRTTEFARFSSSGNLGIGESSPNYTIHAKRDMASTPSNIIYLEMSGTNTDGGGGAIRFDTSASNTDEALCYASIEGVRSSSSDGSGELQFFTTDVSASATPAQRMVIDETGNVGIGTTSPSSAYKLDVQNGSSNVLSRLKTTGSIAGQSYQTGTGHYRWSTQNTGHILYNETEGHTALSIDSSGNVDIPTGGLEINSTEVITSARNLTNIVGITATGNIQTTGTIQTTNESVNAIKTRFLAGMASGSGYGDGPLFIQQSKTDPVNFFYSTTGNPQLNIYGYDTGSSSTKFGRLSIGSDGAFNVTSDSESIKFNTGSSERVRIASSGTVGIGTSSPLAKLDVRGVTWTYGSGDGTVVQKLGRLDNNANVPLFNIYTDDAGTTRPHGGDALEFNSARYSPVIGGTRGSAAGGDVKTWRFTNSTNGDERGTTLLLFTQFDSSSSGSTDTSATVRISATSNVDSYINTSANFGLGTSAPSQKLHVDGNIRVGDANDIVYTNRLTALSNASLDIAGNTGQNITFKTGSSERVRINSNGQFGIGVTDFTNALRSNGKQLIIGSCFAGTSAALVVDDFSRFGGALYIHQDAGGSSANVTSLDNNGARLVITGKGGTTANALDAPDGFYVSGQQIVTSARNLTNIGTISSGAITATGAVTISDSLVSSTPLSIGSSAQTSFTYQQWKTSSHGDAEAYIIAYGASHSSQAGNFAMKNLEANGEIFFELAGSVEPLRFASNGAATFNKAFTFPTSDGSANQVLKTDGSGNVTWATEAAVSASTSISDADGDTKIQVEESADEDKIRFDTAGTERMVILANGNVGISDAAPSKTLSVTGTFKSTGEAFFSHFDNTTSSSRMRDNLRLNFGNARTFAITGNSTNMHMKNGTTDVMTFDTSNRVGIGTTSPSQKLQVAGTILADTALAASSGTTAIGIGSESDITDTSSTYRIKLLSNSNNAKLTTYAYSSYLTLKAGVDGGGYANNWSKIELRDGGGTGSNNAHMKFYTHGDERMVIDNDGNVGIGTTSPSWDFVVSNAGAGGLEFGPDGIGAGTSFIQAYNRTSSTYDKLRYYASEHQFYIGGSNHALNINSNGNVGIGTNNPIQKLQVTGSIYANGGNIFIDSGNRLLWGNSQQFIEATNSGPMQFGTGNAERMRIDSNGNVGIGTTSPGQKLTVRGATELSVGDVSTGHATEFNWVKSNTGSSGDGVWYKVADISLPAAAYSAMSFEAYYETGLNNFGSHNYLDVREVFVSIVRNSSATLNNSPDSATLRGRTDDIRVYKTAAGTYELQARHNSENAKYAVRVRVFQTNGGTITPVMSGSTAGTTSGGTAYTVAEPVTTEGVRRYFADIDSSRIHLGSSDVYPSGNGLYVHYSGSGFIPSSTTPSSNASLGTSTYLWNGVFSRRFQGEVGTAGVPTFTFSEDSNTGMYDEWYDQSNSLRQLSFTVDGTRRLHVNQAGVWSAGNFYLPTGGSLRSFGTYTEISNGTSGNGFRMRNTADSVDSLIVTSAGNGTFAGAITSSSLSTTGSAVSSFAGPVTVNGTTLANAFEFQVNGDAKITNYLEASQANFGNTTLTGFLRGPSTFTIDPAAHGNDTGTVVIAGNLQVDGTTTTINSTTLTVDDKNITLASGSTNAAAANGAGLTVDCGSGTDATFTYVSATDDWKFDKPTRVSGLTNAGIAFSSTETLVDGSSALPNGRIFYHSSRLIYDSPSSGHRFAVAGNQGTNLALEIYSNRDIGFYNSSGAADLFWDASTSRLGIGTTSPGHLLHVTGADGSIANMVVNNDNVALRMSAYTNSHGEIRVETNHPLVIKTNGNNERMRITETGNVGIGLTDPDQKLDVNGNIRIPNEGKIVFGSAGASPGDYLELNDVNSSGSLLKLVQDSTTRLVVQGVTGNVGIGETDPDAKLQVEELGIDTTTTSTSATTQVAIDTFAAATFRSARYTIQVTNSTDSTYHITEILLIHDGTTPQITEYGTIFTGSAEATFDADISSGNVRLLATPATTDSMTFKVVRHCITV